MSLEEVWHPDLGLVRKELACRNGEDLVDFLKCELLGLADEAEDHEPGDQVEAGVEAEGSSLGHDSYHSRERQTENTSKSVVDEDSPGHSLFTLDRWEHLSGVLECYWTFAQRIADREKVDEQDDWSDLCPRGACFLQK